IACRIKERRAPLADCDHPTSSRIDDQNLLPGAGGVAGRVRYFACLVFSLTADVGDHAAVGREHQISQFLTIIISRTGDLPGSERRPFGNPDVSFAFGVKSPSELVSMF